MTSDAPGPHQRTPPQPLTSTQNNHSQPPQASSPPSKRDLKSWWKGFKLPSKHQEPHGTTAPLLLPPSFRRLPDIISCPTAAAAAESKSIPDKQTQLRRPYSSIFSEKVAGLVDTSTTTTTLVPLQTAVSHISNIDLGSTTAASQNKLSTTSGPTTTNIFAVICHNTSEPRPGIFGVPLRTSIAYANVAISLIDENGESYIYGYVPIVVAKCGVFLKEKATGVEGIFRLSGSEKRIKELKATFDSPDKYGKGLAWDGYTVHDASNVLRRYLNDLPEPVVPLNLYEKFREPLRGATKQAVGDTEGPQFVDDFDQKAAIVVFQRLITELPLLNKQLLLYLLDLLAVFAAKSDENRMNSQNLAAIFQPGMLSHPNHAMQPEEYRLNQCVVIFLIENQDSFLIGMQGTEADEKTKKEVESGKCLTVATPSTPISLSNKSSLIRSASTASAGAESVRRDGRHRRNRSTSSRHSRNNDGNSTAPGSPAHATTPTTSGLARSNTVPSRKSPALAANKYFKPDISPLLDGKVTTTTTPTAATATASGISVSEETALPRSPAPSSITTIQGTSLLAPGSVSGAARSQERLLESSQESSSPSNERRLPAFFTRAPTGDGETRQPNKLKKRRAPGNLPSAQSSQISLPPSNTASPSVEIGNPLEAHNEILEAPAIPQRSDSLPTRDNEASIESKPRALQTASLTTNNNNNNNNNHQHNHNNNNLHPDAPMMRSKKSPPTSLHSSFNEGSDIDNVDDVPMSAISVDATDKEKDKKKRWRLSRGRKDEFGNGVPNHVPMSPRSVIGSNRNADVSVTSIGSAAARPPRKSFTGDSNNDYAATASAAARYGSQDQDSLNHPSIADSRDTGKDESKGPIGWIKNKYREAKENVDQRRNKSPPASRQPSGGASSVATDKGSEGKPEPVSAATAAPVPATHAATLAPAAAKPAPMPINSTSA